MDTYCAADLASIAPIFATVFAFDGVYGHLWVHGFDYFLSFEGLMDMGPVCPFVFYGGFVGFMIFMIFLLVWVLLV